MPTRLTLPRRFSVASVQKAYARVAWFYDLWGTLTESRATDRALQLAEVRDGQRVLEVATGTGRLLRRLLECNPSGITIGVDLSPAMLQKAGIVQKQGNVRAAGVLMASAYQLPFKNEIFDRILNNYMFDLLPEEDFLPVIREFHRVMAAGGRLVITTMGAGNRWYHRFWSGVARVAPSLLTGCRPVDLSGYLPQAGFKVEKVELVSQNTFPSEVFLAVKG